MDSLKNKELSPTHLPTKTQRSSAFVGFTSKDSNECGWEILKCPALSWPNSEQLALPLEFPVR